jgi:surface protein
MIYLVPSDTFFFLREGSNAGRTACDEVTDNDFFLWMISDFLVQSVTDKTGSKIAVQHNLVFGPVSYLDTSQLTRFEFNTFPFEFNENISRWDVSNVTRMAHLFRELPNFDQPLEEWNVSNVTDMDSMFLMTKFNQPLEKWDVSNVTDMSAMFACNGSFNQSLEKWNITNVTDMCWMFFETTAFNQSLETWKLDRKEVNTIDMFGLGGMVQ